MEHEPKMNSVTERGIYERNVYTGNIKLRTLFFGTNFGIL